MSATIEIAYFNTFILAGGGDTGTPHDTQKTGLFHVEESRIKGGYNNTSVDFGVKAYFVDDEYEPRIRENALIYSGIYNSKTKTNNSNQFPSGKNITKAVDIANGSIQKLHAEDNDLTIFQENKVMRAQIDKDSIYTAEGQPISTISNVVIGQVVPYLGKYGISKNPESFAFNGGRKYFADKNRGVIMRLSRDGLTPISMYGLKDFFRDKLLLSTSIYGMYDEQKDKYIISLQGDGITGGEIATSATALSETSNYLTLSFGENQKGWTSFYTYKPSFGFSLSNKFYTFNSYKLYEHYKTNVPRCNFYGASYDDPAYVKLILNDEPSTIKNFLTINYEGSTGWYVDTGELLTASYKKSTTTNAIVEDAYKIAKEGVTIPNVVPAEPAGFVRKEQKYFGFIKSKNNDRFSDNSQFTTTGLKGNYLDVTMKFWEPEADSAISVEKAELFAVSSEAKFSSK